MKNIKTKKPVAKKSTVKKTTAWKKSVVTPVKTAPVRKTGFRAAMSDFFARYFAFNGTSTRAQYWWVTLFVCVIMVLCIVVLPWLALAVGSVMLAWLCIVLMWLAALFGIAIIIPSLALMSRRIHDAGLSAWVFFAPQIIVSLMEWFRVPFSDVLSISVGIFGLVLTLLPSKLKDNPYRE